ncbi:MAG: polyprenyl synthetase family protein, partial [Actinomycetales bacterium]
MCHWGFVAAGGEVGTPAHDDVVRAAAALETLHLFALVHDDVMDQSVER